MATHAPITGAPTRAPFVYRPDALDSSTLLPLIETALARLDMAHTRFGREAVGDPWLVRDLRDGRRITPRRASRIRAFLEGR